MKRPLAVLLSSAGVLLGQAPDVGEIVRRSLERDQVNFNRAKDYTCVRRVEQRDLDASGKVRKTESQTYEVIMIAGRPYSRRIAHNDKPLEGDEARRAQESFDRAVRKRLNESEPERRKREADEERNRQQERAFLREIPEAFTFDLVREETVGERAAWVIDAKPRPGFRAKAKRAETLSKFRGRIWVDQKDYQWVRVEAETIAPVAIGWVLARLNPGAKLTFEQARINDEIWLPVRMAIRMDARLALLKRFRAEVEGVWRDYRKFRTDSRVVSAEEIPGRNPRD